MKVALAIEQISLEATEKLAKAQKAAEVALKEITATNATTQQEIVEAVKKAVDKLEYGIATDAKADFVKTDATKEKAGSVSGEIVLSLEGKTEKVTVALAIEQIPLEAADKLAKAKKAAEAALEKIVATNDTTQEEIVEAVKKAVDALKFDVATAAKADFVKTEATKEAAGSVSGVIKLSLEGQTAEITVTLVIEQIPRTAEEKLAKAKTAAEKALKEITAENATTQIDILNKVEAAVDALGYGVKTELLAKFTMKKATTDEEGSIAGTIVLSLEDKTANVEVAFTIPKIALTADQMLKKAQEVAGETLEKIPAKNTTTQTGILEEVTAAVDALGYGVKTEVKDKIIIKKATKTDAGSINGTIVLSLENKTVEVKVAFEIEKLHEHVWPAETETEKWQVTKPATEKQEGKKQAKCELQGCGQKKVVPIIGTNDSASKLEKDAEVAVEAPLEGASFDNKKDEILKAPGIFDSDDKNKNARVWLEINKTDEESIKPEQKDEVKKKAEAFVGEGAEVTYFDADLFKKVENENKQTISEPGIFIAITITIPKELLNRTANMMREYKIIRLHNGKVDVLEGTFNKETNEFTFKTDKFSTYALAYNDVPRHDHQYPDEVGNANDWSTDSSNHWYKCTDAKCTVKKAYGAHTYQNSSDKDCDICGYTRKVSGGGSSGSGGGIYYPSYIPTVTATPTPKPTATPVPTATPIPTATPVPTATPIPGVVNVPTMEETVMDENGNAITSIVQDAGTQATVKIPGVTDNSETKVTWISTNPAIASVDENGKISMLTPGITEILITAVKGSVTKRHTIVVLVEKPPVYINEVLEAFKNVRLGTCWEDIPLVRTQMVGETVDINFWGVKNWKKENYEYVWTTSDETIAVTDKVGKVTALKPGVITMSLGLKNKLTGAFLNVKDIEIVIPADMENKIVLGTSRDNTFDKLELKQNQRIDINFYGVKNWKKEEYEYYWSSTEPTTVWVDEVGKITPIKTGEAIITLILVEKATGYPKYVIPATITVK